MERGTDYEKESVLDNLYFHSRGFSIGKVSLFYDKSTRTRIGRRQLWISDISDIDLHFIYIENRSKLNLIN